MASPIAEQQTSRTARSIWLDKPMKKSSTGGRAASLTSAGPSAEDGNAVVSPASCAALSQIPSRTSSAAGSRPPSTAAVAFQQASEAYHEALMEKRLELVQQMQAALTDTSTVACQSIAAYSHCLEGVLTDIAFEVFEEGQWSQGRLETQVSDSEVVLPLYEPAPQGMDIFGQVIPHAPTERVRCMHCETEVAAARFAAHLDKCLSGGRNGRRAGRARS